MKRHMRKPEQMSLPDSLNRKYFARHWRKITKNAGVPPWPLSSSNVDDFKLYNQLYGNHEGDKALVHIARIIQGTVGITATAAGRYSGKEFAVILPDYDIYSAQNLAEEHFAADPEYESGLYGHLPKALTVSCGICATPYAAASMNELISNADCAVYHVEAFRKERNPGILGRNHRGLRDTDEGLAKKHRSMYSEYAPHHLCPDSCH